MIRHRMTHRHRPVVERRSRQAQQKTLPADADLRVDVINQLAQFTGIRGAEISCEPLQLHLQPLVAAKLLRNSTTGTAQTPCPDRILALSLFAAGEQNTGASQQLLHPLTHLNLMDRVVGGEVLNRLTATDRLHGNPGIELEAMGTAFAQLLRGKLRQR